MQQRRLWWRRRAGACSVVEAPSSLPVISRCHPCTIAAVPLSPCRCRRAVVAASPRCFPRAIITAPFSTRRYRSVAACQHAIVVAPLSLHRCPRAIVAACPLAVIAAPLSPYRCPRCRCNSLHHRRRAVVTAPLSPRWNRRAIAAAPFLPCRCRRVFVAAPCHCHRAVDLASLSPRLCRHAMVDAALSPRHRQTCRLTVVPAVAACPCTIIAAPL